MFARLPPSRTFTLAAMGMGILSVHGVGLLVCISLLLVLRAGQPDTISIVNAFLGVLSSVVLSIAGCSVGGATGMVVRDSVSRGATTSGAQLDAADKAVPVGVP